MKKYHYKAKTEAGKGVSGTLAAKNEQEVYTKLKQDRVVAYRIHEIEEVEERVYKLKAIEVSDFSRQLGNMQTSGISIVKAIGIMKEKETNSSIQKIYEKVYKSINQGNSISTALELCNGSFPPLIINMYQAGEVSGKLDQVALKMAEYYEKEYKMNTKIKNAMAYPVLLAVVLVVVMIMMFTMILPRFFTLFEGIELPLITEIIMMISNAFINHFSTIIGIGLILIFITCYLVKTEPVARKIDVMKLKTYKIGRLVSIIYTARFARTLSSLYISGLSMLEAVSISAKTVGNTYIEDQFFYVLSKIKAGTALSEAMKDVDGIDQKIVASIYIGEESGKLEEMLISMADIYEYEANSAIKQLITIMEPVMIIIVATFVGILMLAVMLPLLTIYSSIGN